MTKFNKLFNTKTTWVRPVGCFHAYKVKEINDTRTLIKVEGLCGSFQRAQIEAFTNKGKDRIWTTQPRYELDGYGGVLDKSGLHGVFIGKLNGRTLSDFLSDNDLVQEDIAYS